MIDCSSFDEVPSISCCQSKKGPDPKSFCCVDSLLLTMLCKIYFSGESANVRNISTVGISAKCQAPILWSSGLIVELMTWLLCVYPQ